MKLYLSLKVNLTPYRALNDTKCKLADICVPYFAWLERLTADNKHLTTVSKTVVYFFSCVNAKGSNFVSYSSTSTPLILCEFVRFGFLLLYEKYYVATIMRYTETFNKSFVSTFADLELIQSSWYESS